MRSFCVSDDVNMDNGSSFIFPTLKYNKSLFYKERIALVLKKVKRAIRSFCSSVSAVFVWWYRKVCKKVTIPNKSLVSKEECIPVIKTECVEVN